MNKAFEKILDRMDEMIHPKQLHFCKYARGGCKHLYNNDKDCMECVVENAIEIVKEVAEEYNDGWIPCSERLPEDDKNQYIVQKTNGSVDILGFTKDAYKLSRYDFAEYKGKKKQLFYDYDSEYGYSECECVVWQPLPEPFKESD